MASWSSLFNLSFVVQKPFIQPSVVVQESLVCIYVYLSLLIEQGKFHVLCPCHIGPPVICILILSLLCYICG